MINAAKSHIVSEHDNPTGFVLSLGTRNLMLTTDPERGVIASVNDHCLTGVTAINICSTNKTTQH